MLYNKDMTSIQLIKGSDGSGNAAVATVQSTRSTGATTIVVDTVAGINTTGFAGSMGTPHTFTDPITSETITVISEATAVDFIGHVDGSNLEIDTIAPGYTDAGSAVGDIVIIRPTTQYADNIADVLEVEHNNDGTLKTDSVVTAKIKDANVTYAKVANGIPVQVVNTLSGAVATGSTTIPSDDTKPQITEGDEYMTLAITPKSATNVLVIEVIAFVSYSAAVSVNGAIFQDSTADALAAGAIRNTVGTEMNMLVVRHTMAAGTTSATTFRFRAGGDSAGTLTFNGSGGARRFGGITCSSMVITEYKA